MPESCQCGTTARLLRKISQPEFRVHRCERHVYRHTEWVRAAAQLQHLLRGSEAPAAQRTLQQDLLEQIALRVAAANLAHASYSRRQSIPGAGVVAAGVGVQTLAAGQRDFPPYGSAELRRALCVAAHRFQQRFGLAPIRTRQSVQVLQSQEGLYRVIGACHEMIGEILPAQSNIDARDLESCQQRNGADLILRIVLGDAPAMFIVEFESLSAAPLAQIKQRQMPP